MALCTGPFTVNFAVQMQFKTHCEPDTTVAPLLCVAYELVRPQPPTASTAAQGASGHLRSLLSALRPSGGFMAPG